ncbi:hypothetical protein [Acinetobacter phage ABPH49]|nr:hypothetical protein [Acinetobacter phage ABPH49]
MEYVANVMVVGSNGDLVAFKAYGPFKSYEYAAGIAQKEVMNLWTDLCLDDTGLSFSSSVVFGEDLELEALSGPLPKEVPDAV